MKALDAADTLEVRGVTLRRDPAREPCFHIARLHSEMRGASDTSEATRRDMLHREYNQEVLALEIAAQTLVDFPEAPWELRMELARQCWDEARHAEMRFQRLLAMGGYKGEFPILTQEWGVLCMLDSLAARLAIQNRVFEAGSLDAMRQTIDWWQGLGDTGTAEAVDVILHDEVHHVRFGNEWLERMMREDPRVLLKVAAAMEYVNGVIAALSPQPGDTSIDGVDLYNAKRPIQTSEDDRREAGFGSAEIAAVVRQEQADTGSQPPSAAAPLMSAKTNE